MIACWAAASTTGPTIWNLANGGRVERTFQAGAVGYDVAFNKDGSMLASMNGPIVTIWNTATGQVATVLKGQGGVINSLDFVKVGQRVAWTDLQGGITSYNFKSGKPILARPPEGQSKQYHSIRFSPDGKRLAAGSNSGQVWIFDAFTGAPLLSMPVGGRVFGVAFTTDGSRLAAASETNTVLIGDAASGKVLFRMRHP